MWRGVWPPVILHIYSSSFCHVRTLKVRAHGGSVVILVSTICVLPSTIRLPLTPETKSFVYPPVCYIERLAKGLDVSQAFLNLDLDVEHAHQSWPLDDIQKRGSSKA